VAILVNSGCASTTEQFLLFARQSSKTIIMGENTQGTLDYSNMRQASFSCLPYILRYATTRSRRLDIKQGIDEEGIKPNIYLKREANWINEAVRILEKGK
jgi:C-terminal processing protease CtpA/Prc